MYKRPVETSTNQVVLKRYKAYNNTVYANNLCILAVPELQLWPPPKETD